MIIGGIQKSTLIDFPGKIACILFFAGCNFSCPYCHNPELVTGKPSEDPSLETSAVLSMLEDRRGFLDGVVISGGEPTLAKEIDSFCLDLRRMGFLVKLDTNGSRPDVLARLFEKGLIDYVAMDLKADPAQYDPILWKNARPSAIRNSIRTILDAGLPHEFKTTCVAPMVSPDAMKQMAEAIQGAHLYALQKCRQERVLRPTFFEGEGGRNLAGHEIDRLRAIAEPYVRRCIIR